MTSIRFQLAVATVVISLLMTAILLPFAKWRIDSGFHTFEATYADQELDRLELILKERAILLSRTALDYSRWNHAVEYIAGSRPDWVDENLTEDVFKNFNVSMIAVADRQLRVRDVRTGTSGALAGSAKTIVSAGGTCNAAIKRRQPLHRFDFHQGAPHVIVCSPIMTTEPNAPVVGVLVWAVDLSGMQLADIARLTQFPFTLRSAPGASRVVHFESEQMLAQTPVRDWDGHVAVRADVKLPLPLGAQRKLATDVMLILLVVALLMPPVAILLLMELYVVRRIKRISHWVRAERLVDKGHAGRRHEDHLPIPHAGFAELEMLTQDFTELTHNLEVSRASWRNEAMHDSLTGLPSRPSLLADLTTVLGADHGQVALLMIDLDGFKAVNDTLGHPIGDIVLQEVARDLQRMMPPAAKAYRLGGDEFAVVWSTSSQDSPEGLARLLCADLRLARNTAGNSLLVTASIGVSLASPDSPISASELLSQADVALYEAKHGGRSTYRMFSSQSRANQSEHFELEARLRLALAESRLTSWFQPIISAKDGGLLAIEAIAHWHEPDRGLIDQTRLIGVAERTGQIADVNSAVIACSLKYFQPMQSQHPMLRLHINVSARSLVNPSFVAWLDAALDGSGIARTSVVIELAESGLDIGDDDLDSALSHLRANGVELVVDEFGMGVSSLARLAAVHPSAVKISGSFVRDIDGDGGRMCRAIVALAREFGVQSFAEYIGQKDHAQLLTAMGCDALQGHAISTPLPHDEMLAWLKDRKISTAPRS